MYEYEVINIENLTSIDQKNWFNKLGKDDWELIAVNDKYAYFVRYKEDEKQKCCAKEIDMETMKQMVYGEYESSFLD